MVLSFSVVLDVKSANASPIVPGLNATAAPNAELALRNRRRELPYSRVMVSSFDLQSKADFKVPRPPP